MMGLFTKKSIPILLLSALLSSFILMASVPPVSRDALTHHLAVPKLYVQEGAIHELPEIIPSYYPQLLYLIYCIPLIFDADIIPKYIHFSFFFQAEDGIRDWSVTGVQTCALPIEGDGIRDWSVTGVQTCALPI